jgi:hypothetical protein
MNPTHTSQISRPILVDLEIVGLHVLLLSNVSLMKIGVVKAILHWRT